jgi:hypothetical protein
MLLFFKNRIKLLIYFKPFKFLNSLNLLLFEKNLNYKFYHSNCEKNLILRKGKKISKFYSKEEFGYYLAGLLEGDGHISIPAYGKTTLNRILNPRFVFTFHQKDIELYKNIQLELKGKGRFETKG